MATPLQKLARQVTWFRFFIVRPIPLLSAPEPLRTYKMFKLINQHNAIIEQIRLQAKEDYEAFKEEHYTKKH